MAAARITSLPGGVHQITLPLPWALDHVHCYAVAGSDGWTIVDCGLGTPDTIRGWAEALSALGSPRIRQIVITHYHPDHVGASRALAELTSAEEIVQGSADAELTQRAWGAERDERAFEAYLRLHGMPAAEATRSTGDEYRTAVDPAAPTRLVREGDTVEMAGETFVVLVLPGHADGHIALMGERSGRLFGGDVLLHDITPNVARWQHTRLDPLGRYLQSLLRIEELAPRLVHPGHRRLIEDGPARAAEIRAHHAIRLDVHVEALQLGAETAYDVARHVWGDDLGLHERRFALVEAISHLERLSIEGRAVETAPGRWRANLRR